MFGGDEKPIKVLSVKPEIRNVEKTVSNTRAGTIDACRRSKMSPAAAGQISVLHVEEGDSVSEGDILLELWNKETRQESWLLRGLQSRHVLSQQNQKEMQTVRKNCSQKG